MRRRNLKPIESYLSRYLDGELSPGETRVVESHLKNDPELQSTLNSLRSATQDIQDAFSEIEPMNTTTLRLQQFLTTLPQTVELKAGHPWYETIKSFFANPMKLKYAGIAASFVILALIVVPTMILPHLSAMKENTESVLSSSDEKYAAESEGVQMTAKYGKGVSTARTESETQRGFSAGNFSAGYPIERYPQDRGDTVMGRRFQTTRGATLGATVLSDTDQSEMARSLGYTGAGGGSGGRKMIATTEPPTQRIRENDAVQIAAGEAIQPVPSPDRPTNAFVAQGDADGDGVQDSPRPETPSDANAAQVTNQKNEEPELSAERKIIRNANMAVEVKTLGYAQKSVDRIVAAAGGMTASVMQREKENPPWAQYSLWIPAEKLDSVLDDIKKLGEVQNLEVSVQDIGEQYFDQETRIKNLQRQEERLLKLYDRDTVKMEELLKVEQEIARVRTEVEQMQGRQRLWDRQIRYSTLSLNLIQKRELEPIAKSEAEDVFSPVRRAYQDALAVVLYSCSLVTTLIAWIFSFAVFIVPWIVVVAAVWWGGKRLIKR